MKINSCWIIIKFYLFNFVFSEKSSESDLDALEDLQVEQENEELEFKSDHEFSPESDLDEEAETVQPTKHARTAKAGMFIVKEDLASVYYSIFFVSIF